MLVNVLLILLDGCTLEAGSFDGGYPTLASLFDRDALAGRHVNPGSHIHLDFGMSGVGIFLLVDEAGICGRLGREVGYRNFHLHEKATTIPVPI